MSEPRISVACASRRSVRLAFLLEALAAQTLPLSEFEVIVARDDGSAGPQPRAPEGLRLTYLHAEGTTPPSVRRNMAWRAARAPVVAFTDDDCRPAPGWLEALLEAGDRDRVIQGRTLPDPDEAHLLHGLARSQQIAAPSKWRETCNMAYPRTLLEQLGGFEEGYGFGGEDTDLALRARDAGTEIAFAPQALVWHAVETPTLRGALRGAWRWQGMNLFVKHHPGSRSLFFARFFWKPSHALWLLGAATVAAPIGLWAGLAGWLPYAAYRLGYRHLRQPTRTVRGLVYLPQIAAVDAVEIAACVRDSVRTGTVLV